MDYISQLLLDRTRKADQACRERVLADLKGLGNKTVAADTGFLPSRMSSSHDYDLHAQVRVLEAVQDREFKVSSSLAYGSESLLSSEDQKEIQQAIKDINADQRHFFAIVKMLTKQLGNSI